MNERYAIVDIETTGGMYNRDKITEVGIVIMEGLEIRDTYETLINPERSIPEFITRITGIDDRLVEQAPKFYEVARDIVEWTDNALFVAHNVDFDYRFIRHEFEQLGYTYTRKKLCTIKLARRYYPGLRSYSLGNLIREFSIDVDRRHRALDDALASAAILQMVLRLDKAGASTHHFLRNEIAAARLPDGISPERVRELPDGTGLYYFVDKHGELLYIGKSINIRKRILQHFSANNQKSADLRKRTADIQCELTGSELIALLRESEEIKKYLPPLNRAQRTRHFPYVVYSKMNEEGYMEYRIAKWSKKEKKANGYFNEYASLRSARGHLSALMDEYELCHCLSNLQKRAGPCPYHQLGSCRGAGLGIEPAAEYNERLGQSQQELNDFFPFDFVMTDRGRTADEVSVIGVRDGSYYGYGYLPKDEPIDEFDRFFDHMEHKPSNTEMNRIIFRHYYEGRYGEIFRRDQFSRQ